MLYYAFLCNWNNLLSLYIFGYVPCFMLHVSLQYLFVVLQTVPEVQRGWLLPVRKQTLCKHASYIQYLNKQKHQIDYCAYWVLAGCAYITSNSRYDEFYTMIWELLAFHLVHRKNIICLLWRGLKAFLYGVKTTCSPRWPLLFTCR